MKILVINAGSSSLKWQLFDLPSAQSAEVLASGREEELDGSESSYRGAVSAVASKVKETHALDAVAHRVVHGGKSFVGPTIIDDAAIAAIDECSSLAPLHNPGNLAGIRAAKVAFPALPHVAIFDTAFHARMPSRAKTYAIDEDLAQRERIQRYGFHGSSHAYVAQKAAEYLGTPLSQLRLISCHLGNGASVSAIEFGRSVETSMGMTPLEGLVMGTRSGDLDPGVVLHLCRLLGIDATDELLNRNSGLRGMCGESDMRRIYEAAAEGDEHARHAIGVFAHQVRKYIGAYLAVMGGADAVIFTGGIGENANFMRRRIIQRFEFAGLRLDEDKNSDVSLGAKGQLADVSLDSSRMKTLVIATDEELYMARACEALVRGEEEVKQPAPIPIAISARHCHLDRETMDALFGEGSELEVYRQISQPGQFASKQKVNIVGPKGRIDGVRILGPLRSKNQFEVSRTDEFRLGVDAPIRRSGQVEGSAPITVEGPKATLTLSEGLICARRHIHMTTADAEAYGVSDGDEVEVEVRGGPRDLTFGDVLVRVKDSYSLEMHIDTDEANAAELSRGAQGELVYEAPAEEGTEAVIVKKRLTPLATQA